MGHVTPGQCWVDKDSGHGIPQGIPVGSLVRCSLLTRLPFPSTGQLCGHPRVSPGDFHPVLTLSAWPKGGSSSLNSACTDREHTSVGAHDMQK